MFTIGGGFGPRSGAPTSMEANAAAGLPHADVPGDLREKVIKVLEHEPDHTIAEVPWRHDQWDRRPFTLVRFLWPHRFRLAAAIVLVLIETVALQMGPVLTQIGIDDGVRQGRRDVLVTAAVVYVASVLVAGALGRARVSYTGNLGERLNDNLRIRVFSHMQRQSIDYYNEEKAGVLITRMTSDIEALAVLFQEGIVNLLVQIFTLLVITSALFFYDPLLAVITLAVAVPPTLITSLWFRDVSARSYLIVRDRIAALLANLAESLAGIRVIAAHNRRSVNLAMHSDLVGEHRDAAVAAAKANSTYAPATEFVGICTQAVLLGVGGAMVVNGRISIGEMTAFLLFLTSFFAPIQTLVQLYNSYQQGGAAIVKLRELLGTESSVVQAPDAYRLPPINGEIELRDVTFGYADERPVLHNVSLRIAAGETLAFVGETGAGKSTVAQLLMRFYDPQEGSILIDGHDLRTVEIASLRSQLGVVPQEPFLFAGVVRDNLAFAQRDASDRTLWAALQAVGIDDLVERLGGLDAVVHERGASLSAGERQLLALARALVARPRVLILDEATSNLDLVSESRVEVALDVVLESRTAVIIAHRLATARRADRIAVVHDGEIVELGSHDELVALGNRYAAMYATWVDHGGAK